MFENVHTPTNKKYLYNISSVQNRPDVLEVVPTVYKCGTNVLCLLGQA